jgi:YggT family protein
MPAAPGRDGNSSASMQCGPRTPAAGQPFCSTGGDRMPILASNFLNAVATVLKFVLNIYMWIIIARAVLSWVSPDPYNPIVRFIHNVTEPVLFQVRRRLPVVFGGIDLSPVVVFLVILFLEYFVVNSLYELAAGIR